MRVKYRIEPSYSEIVSQWPIFLPNRYFCYPKLFAVWPKMPFERTKIIVTVERDKKNIPHELRRMILMGIADIDC